MKRKYLFAGISFAFLIIVTLISFNQLSTPAPALPGYTPDSYSAYRALEHLKFIAKEPHSENTTGHKHVRNYIYDQCKKLGLETKVLSQTGLRSWGRRGVRAGKAMNVLAKLKGTDNTKALLVMGHYDSQPNTPGASDDGASIASMLETMELLTKQGPLKNDIYFLMTDLEEIGLLGAEAFVHSYPELDDIGMLINFDARGNTGINFTFETTSENGWIIKEFSKAVDKPMANALAYEIYKLMPNGSDFTEFKDTSISGLNSAFIEGYAYYHSPADTWQNIDLSTLQHQGDLMWQMVNHFGNIDLTETKDQDAIFFSLLGQLIIYPASLDWPLIIVAIILFAMTLMFLKKNGSVQLIGSLKGLGLYLLIILFSLGLVWAFNALILWMNPNYSSFYGNNFYNSNIYIWTVIGACLMALGVCSKFVFQKISTFEFLLAALFIQIILIIVLKIFVPTGAFILYVPLIVNCIIIVLSCLKQKAEDSNAPFLIIVVPLLLWVPFVYFLFVVFSFSIPYACAFFVLILIPYLVPLMKCWTQLNIYSILIFGVSMVALSLAIGQLTSSPSDEYPQQTSLFYGLDLDKNQAFWFSRQENKDEFVSLYISSDEQGDINEIYPAATAKYWKEKAPAIIPKTGHIEVISDTTINDIRNLELRITPGKGVTSFELILEEGSISKVDNREVKSDSSFYLNYFGPQSIGCSVIVKTSADKLRATFIESKMEIDKSLFIHDLPSDYIFAPGYMSNNMLIKQTIVL
uniref:M28 family peptidase n=1 Tax=Fulvivirga sp. TaxID=1931237 RepID=UPI00404B8932